MNISRLESSYRFIEDAGRRSLALHAFTPENRQRGFAVSRPPTLSQAERIVFYDFPSSPFCIKVRAMLQHKGLKFMAVDPLKPGRWLELQTKARGKVPTITIDGRFVADSTDIAYELDRLYPQRPLLPPTSFERAQSHAFEEWADESIYFVGLHCLWLHPDSRAQMPALFGSGLTGMLRYRFYLRMIERQVRGQGTGRKTAEHIERDLLRHLDSAQGLLQGRDYLLGNRPWLCDFALFGQLACLLRARSSQVFVLARPGLVDYVDRMRALAV